MQREDIDSAFSDLPLQEEIEAFHPDDGPCCTEDRFRVDLNGFPKSAWNVSAAGVFAQSFISAHPECKKKLPEVKKAWIGHLTGLRTKYKLEKESEKKAAQKAKNRRRERRLQLYYRRIETAQRSKLRKVVPLMLELGADGMSSDESDHSTGRGEATYRILQKRWRAPELTQYLRVLDALHLRLRYRGEWDASSGSWPHFRTSSSKISQRPPPTHLPVNFYADDWHNACTSFVQDTLYVQPPKHNLVHPKPVLEYVPHPSLNLLKMTFNTVKPANMISLSVQLWVAGPLFNLRWRHNLAMPDMLNLHSVYKTFTNPRSNVFGPSTLSILTSTNTAATERVVVVVKTYSLL
ncbi:hypothetical protein BJ138DRAFT_1013312 [Hygrophoropsis aurantiaca]|uniref:Uncharacterized protein n=1 Tax=Hygrophoropsis aurantiaca TaxID=72124 RepID=A0ACB8A4A4_9AGAM|nr:hypothetical protein BJ138DRAFT_1013312 [Hygrophoropsis aurantiaca]